MFCENICDIDYEQITGDGIMEKTTELLMGFRSLLRLYDKMLKKVCREHDLSVIEADVVSFLQNNPGKDTAVDIVELRMLSKGAVSESGGVSDTEVASGTDSGQGRQETDTPEAEAGSG